MRELVEDVPVNGPIARVRSVVVDGLAPHPVTVEAARYKEGYGIDVVGLPDAAIRDSRLRVVRAVQRLGFPVKRGRVVVNLAPATVRKGGGALDLPMAVAYAAALSGDRLARAHDLLLAGEISLDGDAVGLRHALASALLARRDDVAALVLPACAMDAAGRVPGVSVVPVASLEEAIQVLRGDRPPAIRDGAAPPRSAVSHGSDLAAVRGQEAAKRALVVAAAGGHNLLMIGPPGSGKTMLARCLPGLLPPLDVEEAVQLACVHEAAGLSREGDFYSRPFRAPHHTASRQALTGGGASPQPGEVSLAHRGVLFLDELPEFRGDVLEVLRQPLEDGAVTIARAREVRTFPCRFALVAAMNPCPCGHAGDPRGTCRCAEALVARYRGRVSGPLWDRIDIHLPVRRVPVDELVEARADGLDTSEARACVEAARAVQAERLRGIAIPLNACIPDADLRRHCALPPALRRRFAAFLEKLGLTGRAYARILRLARTIADLDGAGEIGEGHLSEAMQYRSLDRE